MPSNGYLIRLLHPHTTENISSYRSSVLVVFVYVHLCHGNVCASMLASLAPFPSLVCMRVYSFLRFFSFLLLCRRLHTNTQQHHIDNEKFFAFCGTVFSSLDLLVFSAFFSLSLHEISFLSRLYRIAICFNSSLPLVFPFDSDLR